jgi:hypothetical protein
MSFVALLAVKIYQRELRLHPTILINLVWLGVGYIHFLDELY